MDVTEQSRGSAGCRCNLRLGAHKDHLGKHLLWMFASPRAERGFGGDFRKSPPRRHLNIEKGAHAGNSTMSLIVSQKPVKFLKENSQFVSEPSPGHYVVDYNLYKLHILNLEELSLDGIDGLLLSEFVKNKSKIGNPKALKKLSGSQNILDILLEGLNFRYRHFEGERPMGAVADVTDIVLPKIEEAERKGIEEGKKEGKLETARVMDKKGYPFDDVIEITGLTKDQLKKAGISGTVKQ